MGNQYSTYEHWPPSAFDYEYSYNYLHRSNGLFSHRSASLVQRNPYGYYGQSAYSHTPISPYYNSYSYGYGSPSPYYSPYYSGYYPRAQYALPYRNTPTPLF